MTVQPPKLAPTRAVRRVITLLVCAALAAVTVAAVLAPNARAAGPAYSGPTTEATGPAYFGPAPNPFPYCENPTYFDTFPENVSPIGRVDPTGSPTASVTTNGVTMEFEITAEGDPGGQYPGFFPEGDDGDAGDQPKGLEMASDDAAVITLSEPLFYTQWIFTDVDRENEGFFVTPAWTDPGTPGQVAVFGGDENFDFAGTTDTEAVFNDTDMQGQDSEALAGRVQVDLLGAVTGIDLLRDTGSGQSGFAIGGGCAPIGAAKEVTSGPTWNGTSFDVTYTIRVRNNLPSASTITSDIDAALAAAASGTTSGAPVEITMSEVTVSDLLANDAFSEITIVSTESVSGNVAVNPAFDGIDDIGLLDAGVTIPPETVEEFEIVAQYIPVTAGPLGDGCNATYELLNQATAGGVASGVDVQDLSDEGTNPDPGVTNGAGTTDDPTVVLFDCPDVVPDPTPTPTPEAPAATLEIVKTVIEGPSGACSDFAGGTIGAGEQLAVRQGDTVTYCISVRNPSTVAVDNVVVTDPQAPATFDGALGELAPNAEATLSFDVLVEADTPLTNTASVTGTDPAGGQLPPVTDDAVIDRSVPQPGIALTKTVVARGADCATATEGTDEFLLGVVDDAITWCFTATNTGDVALTNVIFNDAALVVEDLDLLAENSLTVLEVGAAITFGIDDTIPAAGVDNVATVSAAASDATGVAIPGIALVTDENDAATNETALSLDKTVIPGSDATCESASEVAVVNLGDAVTYCFTVTNTGGVDVVVTEVTDASLGATIPIPAATQLLAPGESVTVSLTEISTRDLVNTAEVSGTPVDETGVPFPDPPPLNPNDTAEVDTLSADLSIEKSNNGPTVQAGTIATFSLVVSNAGPDEALDVVVVDALPTGVRFIGVPTFDGWVCTVELQETMTCSKSEPMAVGGSATLTYDVRVGLDAPIEQDINNVANVQSSTTDPDPTNNEDTSTVKRIIVPPRSSAPLQPPASAPPAATVSVPAVTPAEPVPLAVTGTRSPVPITLSIAMLVTGGVAAVGARRRDYELR